MTRSGTRPFSTRDMPRDQKMSLEGEGLAGAAADLDMLGLKRGEEIEEA